MSKDVLLQTRVPARVAREVKRRAESNGDSDASWLRRLLLRETEERAPSPNDEFIRLSWCFYRKAAIISMAWRDPHSGTCANGRDPWVLCLTFVDGGHVSLKTADAEIVLKAFGLSTDNPHPRGTDNEKK